MAIKINGTNTAAAPGITGDDTDTGLVYGTNQIDFSTGGTSRATIDSSGRLLLGTTSASGISSNADDLVIGSTSDSTARGLTLASTTNANIRFADGGDNATGMIEYNHSSNYMRFYVEAGERIRIDSSGNVGIGLSSPVFGSGGGLHLRGPSGGQTRLHMTTSSSGDAVGDGFDIVALGAESGGSGGMMNFIQYEAKDVKFTYGGTSEMLKMTPSASVELFENGAKKLETTGSGVTVTGTVTETSDYRLKENQVAITDGITKVKTLKPYRYNLKEEPTEINMGFFAHEVAEAVPEAVTGLKDAVDADNNLIPQGIAYSHMVPLLTAALQEAVAKIEVLETKVAALEAA